MILLFGGALIVIISVIAVYIDTGSLGDVVDVLLLKKFKRVGISIPFGYFFIILGLIRLFFCLHKPNIGDGDN